MKTQLAGPGGSVRPEPVRPRTPGKTAIGTKALGLLFLRQKVARNRFN
jgi:hypothetical protein